MALIIACGLGADGIMGGLQEYAMIDVSSLNGDQKKAVLDDHKYIRVVAGAGSGKTRVLTSGEIGIRMQDRDMILPCGVYGRWQRHD